MEMDLSGREGGRGNRVGWKWYIRGSVEMRTKHYCYAKL